MRGTELGQPLRRCPFVRWRKRCNGNSKADLREVGIWNTKCTKLFQVLVKWWVLLLATLVLYFCYFRMCFCDGLVISPIVRCSWELTLLLYYIIHIILYYIISYHISYHVISYIILYYITTVVSVFVIVVIFYTLPCSVHTNLFRLGLHELLELQKIL
jgi:hypothetical protein